jgi:hypothetical protein
MSDSDSQTNDQECREDRDPIVDPGPNVAARSAQDRAKVAQFMTTIKNAEQQIGEHIIQALQHADTVAVLTTVVIGPDGQQRVISAALNPNRLQQVQEILTAAETERVEEQPCMGFHCLVKAKGVSIKPDSGTPESS